MSNKSMMILALALAGAATAQEADCRFSYFANGRICVNTLSQIDGKDPILTPPVKGWEDFKPSWSKTGDMLVFFRRVKDDPDVLNWKTVLCVAKADGSKLQRLTNGTYTDFNPTWTRDGKNQPVWNRSHIKGRFIVMRTKVGNKPEQCETLTDKNYHNWLHSCLRDGRMLVESDHPKKGYGYFLMTPAPGGKLTYQRIQDGGMLAKGLMARISISPDETKICYEHMLGYEWAEPKHAIYIADFDPTARTITNHKAIANPNYGDGWYAYPRWSRDGQAVIYHADTTGKGKLFLYTLKDGTTRQVSRNDAVDYRYPHAEDTPK